MSETNHARDSQRDELRWLAEAATPGPWRTITNRPFGPWVNEDCRPPLPADGRPLFARNWKEACLNAAYVAACSPDRILALLTEYDRLAGTLPQSIADVMAERAKQDAQWGGPEHDDTHDALDWHLFRGKFEIRALSQRYAKQHREMVVRIAALAIAEIESIDRQAARASTGPTPE